MSRIPIAVIKGGLEGRFEQLVRQLVPAGRRDGRHWKAPSLTHPGKNREAFAALLDGEKKGGWQDFKTGEKGDPIDLVVYARGGTKADALVWAKDWLGLGGTVDGATLARMQSEAEARRDAAARETAARDERKMRWAFQIWLDASAELAGTVVEAYLAARGTPLGAIPHLEPGEMRVAPALEWWKGAKRDGAGRKIAPGPAFPAMVWPIRSARGEVTAVHCTFLAPDGRGKADVDAPKLMFGRVTGGVIRLARGPSNLSPEDAAAAGIAGLLALGEGVEDGLTLAIAAPEARVWAATSLGNLGNVPLDHPCVAAALVARDNDWSQPQAARGFSMAMDKLAAHGKPLAVIGSHDGKDFNDLVREP